MQGKDLKRIGLISCFILGLLVLGIGFVFSKTNTPDVFENTLKNVGSDWNVTTNQDEFNIIVDLPTETPEVALGNTIILEKQLAENLEDNTYLFFRASHQKIRAYIEGSLIYSFGWEEERFFGQTPASAWILIPLNEEYANQTIHIEITGVYDQYTNVIHGMYMGDRSAIIQNVALSHIGSIIICLCFIIMGISMLTIAQALNNRDNTISLKRLGFLSVVIGLWSLCLTNVLQIFYANVYFLLNIEFFLFYMISPLFIWFLMSFKYYKEKKGLNFLFWISLLQFLLIEFLQVFNFADYLETIGIIHVFMIVSILYLIATGIYDLIKKKAPREVNILIESTIILSFFSGIDIYRFYRVDNFDEGFYSRIGVLLFITIWTVQVIVNMSKNYVDHAKTEALEILAYEDLMTGLKNRTAFEKWVREYQDSEFLEEVYIIVFDMNGLKAINDKLGHTKGDQAIIAISKTIQEMFQEFQGESYRIGGDEICTIFPKKDYTKDFMEYIIEKFKKRIRILSEEMKFCFSVAAGWSDVSVKENRDIMNAYKQADSKMYEQKQKMKDQEKEAGSQDC